MYRSLVVLLAVAPLVAAPAPAPKAKEVELYYAVRVGTEWVMEERSEDRTVETSMTITKVESKDGRRLLTFEFRPERKVGPAAPPRSVLEVSAHGLAQLTEGAAVHWLLKLPAKPGDTW